MSLIADFTLGSPILAPTLAGVPDAKLDFEQQVSGGDDPGRLMFWVSNETCDCLEAALDDDWTVADYTRVTTVGDQTLVRADIAAAAADRLTYSTWVDLDAVVVSASGSADGWRIRMQFPDRDALAAYRNACEQRDVPLELHRLYERQPAETALTPAQREVLELAMATGYFDVPRQTTTRELGDRLGITSQAVSERLRRGTRTAVEDVLDRESGE